MKFLFVVRVMLRDWLTVHRRYTVIIILTMILSVQALFFIAEKNAGENIESIFMERFCNAAYFLKPPRAGDDETFLKNYPQNRLKCGRAFLEGYVSSGLPMPSPALHSSADFSCQAAVQVYERNGVPLYEQEGYPQGFAYLMGIPVFDSSDSRFEEVLNLTEFEYKVIEGRNYTDEELANHTPVIVVDKDSGFELGDRLDCGEHTFEVIGVISSEKYGGKSLIPFWYTEQCMQSYQGYREIETAPDRYADIGGYDGYTLLTRMIYDRPLSSRQRSVLAKLAGTNTDRITLPYEDFLDDEFSRFYRATIAGCAVFGVFCIANIILAVWSLCERHLEVFRTFRVYGASNGAVVRLIVMLIMCITLAAGAVGGLLCIPMQRLYESISPDYAWRPYCMYIAVGALAVINLLAAVPTAILTVRRSPIGKEG